MSAGERVRCRSKIIGYPYREGHHTHSLTHSLAHPMSTTKKALVIGINYVGTSSELSGCVRDTLKVVALLKKYYGYKSDEIHLLVDTLEKNVDEKSIRDADQAVFGSPTRARIEEGLQWLASGAKAGDRRFIHYSGHGTYLRDRNGDEADGQDEALCPVDYATAGMIVDDDIRSTLVDPLPAGCCLFGVLDCCHSGTAMDLPQLALLHERSCGREPKVSDKRTGERTVAATVAVFTGCRDSQTSADAWFGGQAMGAMSRSWTTSLKRWHDVHDGPPSFKKMLRLNLKFMKRKGFTQRPQLNTSAGFDYDQPMLL